MEDTARFLLNIQATRKSFEKNLRPSWLKITTITVVMNIQKPIDIRAIEKALEPGIDLGRDDTHVFKWSVTPTKFHNQITIGYTDDRSKKSIKLFPNGAIQIAGCSDLLDCERVRDQLNVILENFNPQGGSIDKYSIAMINTNFYMSHKLNLGAVLEEFAEYDPSFNSDVYSGVIVKIPFAKAEKPVTVSIFTSGAVIITGAKDLGNIAKAYRQVAFRLAKPDVILMMKSKNQKVPYTLFGFPISKLVKAYQKKYDSVINGNSVWNGRREMHDSCDKQSVIKRDSDGEFRTQRVRQFSV